MTGMDFVMSIWMVRSEYVKVSPAFADEPSALMFAAYIEQRHGAPALTYKVPVWSTYA